jgi:hypothetical protein
VSADDWHAGDAMLRSYARGESGVAVMASIEAHLVRCPSCRARVAGEVDLDLPLEAAWRRVEDRIQEPALPIVVQILRRLGLGEADAVLLSAARSLNGAWMIATLAVVVFAAFAAIPSAREGRALYLLVAPLVPVLGVVAAFASADPLARLTTATPYPKARLALLRTVAVVLTSVPFSVLVGAGIPGIAWLAFAWLLPALALTLLALVAMTRWEPEPVGAGVAAMWIAVIAAAYRHHDVAAAVRGETQIAYLVIAALAPVALALRIGTARTPGGYA